MLRIVTETLLTPRLYHWLEFGSEALLLKANSIYSAVVYLSASRSPSLVLPPCLTSCQHAGGQHMTILPTTLAARTLVLGRNEVWGSDNNNLNSHVDQSSGKDWANQLRSGYCCEGVPSRKSVQHFSRPRGCVIWMLSSPANFISKDISKVSRN